MERHWLRGLLIGAIIGFIIGGVIGVFPEFPLNLIVPIFSIEISTFGLIMSVLLNGILYSLILGLIGLIIGFLIRRN